MKSKSSNVEQRRRKKQKDVSTIRSNPFELRINKQKFKILGRKSKHDRGLPGVSRSKAIKKRKETLLQEFRKRNKVGSFVDKRFGEYDNELSLEERMLQRFTLEKQKHHESKKLYNLDDDEELTHYGQSLGEMANFDDADLKLTDDEEENADKTDTNHFGGFLKMVEKPRGNDEEDKPKSKKEIMEEIVAKSKLKKFERQQAKEEAFQLTQDLDSDWKMIQGLLGKGGDENHVKADDYDILVNELLYETKAKPKDRMKTEEEIAQAEKEKLEKLEAERLERMLSKEERKAPHLSADFLGHSQLKSEDKRIELSYKDGKAVLPKGMIEVGKSKKDASKMNRLVDSGDESNDEDDDNDDDASEEEEEDEDDDEEEDDDDDDDDGDGDGDDTDSKIDDLDNDAAKNNDISRDFEEKITEGELKRGHVGRNVAKKTTKTNPEKQMEMEPSKELPYTFEAPKNLDEFLESVSGWSYDQQLCIIDRIRKCHPVKLDEKNKKKMETLFSILLKYIDHLCELHPIPFSFINKLAKPIFDLVKDSSYHCTCEVQRKLHHLFKRFWMKYQTAGGRSAMPDINEILFLMLVSKVYPTSDLKHGITSPAMTFMTAVLSKAFFQTAGDLISGLLMSNIIYEFQSLSKRFVPEVINFLSGVLSMATKPENDASYTSSLRTHNRYKHCLFLEKETSEVGQKIRLSDLNEEGSEEMRNLKVHTRISILWNCVQLLQIFARLYKELPSYTEIFAPALEFISLIPSDHYPQQVQVEIAGLRGTLCNSELRQPLTLLARKPLPLPLLEPKFDESFEIKSSKRSKDKDANERSKLKYKYKNEMKGAIREVRKDSQFLAKEKLHERIKRDAERRNKTKEIERQLAEQQGELKALDKLKKKKR